MIPGCLVEATLVTLAGLCPTSVSGFTNRRNIYTKTVSEPPLHLLHVIVPPQRIHHVTLCIHFILFSKKQQSYVVGVVLGWGVGGLCDGLFLDWGQ